MVRDIYIYIIYIFYICCFGSAGCSAEQLGEFNNPLLNVQIQKGNIHTWTWVYSYGYGTPEENTKHSQPTC